MEKENEASQGTSLVASDNASSGTAKQFGSH
jgi:hypothetical protein